MEMQFPAQKDDAPSIGGFPYSGVAFSSDTISDFTFLSKSDFYQDIPPVEKAATGRLEYSSCASPVAAFAMPPRRYTDSASLGTTMWHDDFLPRFTNQGEHLDIFSAPIGSDESNILFGPSSFPPRLMDGASPRSLAPGTTGESSSSLIRRMSSKKRPRRRRSSAARCNLCTTPDHLKEGQTRFLRDLPTELLLLIFEFAYLSPIKFPKCEHRRKYAPLVGPLHITRRATANSYFADNNYLASFPPLTPQTVESGTSSTSHDEPPEPSDSLRIYRAKTLLYIALTCRGFNNMLLDHYVDETFWRSAARWCWGWLPEKLADVQGREITHQTSWRNLVGVFMRSENGLFKQSGGGKGGVESFGGNRECMPARLWKDEQARYLLGNQDIDSKKSKLLMVCVQPGPDLFHVLHDSEKGNYTISLNLRGQADYFITLDEYGRFGKKPARLPGGLKRSERGAGYFQPDIFEVEGDRFQLVKLWKGPYQSAPAPSSDSPNPRTQHPKQAVKEAVTWDLHCVDEFQSDPKASVARCSSKDGWLVFNLFTHRDRDGSDIELLLDPPEDSRLFCVQAFGHPGLQPSQATNNPQYNERKSGKMKATDFISDHGPTTIFRWRREFQYHKAADFELPLHLHYVICNFKLNSVKAVVLIRWNVRTAASNEELVDRQFHILDLKTGETIRVLQFPNLYWDHRHHDMSIEYNEMRHKKMSQLYNHMVPDETMGTGNRCTRIHEDDFILTEDKIISGSHDYCNWVWDLNANTVQDYSGGVFNAGRNDAGLADPFEVLDDFYWDEDPTAAGCRKKGDWNTNNERAGWWVRTPNQVMCFWHGIVGSADSRYFAACRPGKMFVWDLEAGRNKVMGYKNCESSGNDNHNNRWLGRLAAHAENLKHRLRNWFVWEEVLPEQGLWLLFDDLKAVYLDRDDILQAAGFGNGKRTWLFQRDDFTFDENGKNDGKGGARREDFTSEEEEWDDDNDESDEEDGVFGRIKRTRTDSFGAEEWGVPLM